MNGEMLAVIEELDSLKLAPVESLSPQAARSQKTIFDAAYNLAARYGIAPPVYTVDATDQTVALNGGQLNLRIYRPHIGDGPFPAIVYFHGGGWVIGSSSVYDASARSLAEQTGAVVVSVDYRRGPEARFPTAHKDAFAAYKWVLANTSFLKIDANRVAVAGEDAGGNLACNVSIMARDSGAIMPKHQLLIYPITQADMTTPSYQQYASAQPLNAAQMSYFFNNYLSNSTQRTDTRITLVNANLSNLPATTIINGDLDPLRDDGLMLEDKLRAAGVPVARKLYDGVTHDFYGLNGVVSTAREAEGYANAALRKALQ
jgi:acetyl esterase/lipase